MLAVLVLAATACTDGGEAEVAIERTDVIAAYEAEGLSSGVAECVVGLGEREFELESLSPGGEVDEVTSALLDEIVASCVQAEAILSAAPAEPEVLALDAGPQDYGDDPRLDFLWDRCEAGDGRACDRLWLDAPIGSVYETFGVTCGERPGILDCGEELVPADADGDGDLVDTEPFDETEPSD